MRVTRMWVGALWAMGCLMGCGGEPVADEAVSAQVQSRCEAGCTSRADFCIQRQLKPVAQCVADRDACLQECAFQQ